MTYGGRVPTDMPLMICVIALVVLSSAAFAAAFSGNWLVLALAILGDTYFVAVIVMKLRTGR